MSEQNTVASDDTQVAAATSKRARLNQFVRVFEKGEVEFKHGEVDPKTGRPSVGSFSVNNLPETVTKNLMVIGLATLLNGTANSGDNPVEDVQALYKELQAGNWPESQRGRAGDETVYHEALVLLAKAQGKKVPIERASEVWGAMGAEKQASMLENKGFKSLVEKVRVDRKASKASASIDLGSIGF